MVIEVFESARRPKCHVTASLRHVRRLESARTPKKAPPSARGAIAKRVVFNARSAIFGVWACFTTYGNIPHDRFFGWTKIPSRTAPAPKNSRFAKKTKKKSPGGIELTTTRRPQQITMGSETMGLTVLLKEPPISPTS